MVSSEVLIRLGSHAEKEYLIKTAPLFAGTIVGANLLEMTPGATISLAWKFATMKREFAIDPVTYVFGINLDYIRSDTKDRKTKQVTRGIKKSFQNICREFGGVFQSEIVINARSLSPSSLSEKSLAVQLCQSVLQYQLTRMKALCQADPQLKEVASDVSPSFVFAPYFYIPAEAGEASKAWESLNLTLISEFGKLKSPVPKHAVLCFGRRILRDRDRLLGMLNNVADSGCDAAWFWVSNLREEDITEAELINLVLLVKAAGSKQFQLRNLHGGFLSALLSKHGLTGFSHSIGYGESKDVFPVSGGAVPTVSYHYTPLHVKCSVPDIERAFSTLGIARAEDFHKVVCNCAICVGTLKGDLRNFRRFGELGFEAK